MLRSRGSFSEVMSQDSLQLSMAKSMVNIFCVRLSRTLLEFSKPNRLRRLWKSKLNKTSQQAESKNAEGKRHVLPFREAQVLWAATLSDNG
jgi:hypothetical protein